MSAAGVHGSSPFARSPRTMSAAADIGPDLCRHSSDIGNLGAAMSTKPDIATDLALRAGLDPAWDAVLAVYLAGLARWPAPFQPRKPTPPSP